jgi:dihydroneopterin aldolase
MLPSDVIEIRRLRVATHIGVPDAERAQPQTVCVTVRMIPKSGFDGLDDEIARTIDYHEVSLRIADLAKTKARYLIETLGIEIAEYLLANFPVRHVAVTIEKHILPQTECVAIHLERTAVN